MPTSSPIFFKTLTFRNFLSFGNNDTIIDLNGKTITVVMGENIDCGGEDSKNGVGKSAIVDSLCYVFFGKVIRGISNPKLVNKLTRRGQYMMVDIIFEKGNYEYRISRGEKPSKLFFYKRPIGDTRDWNINDNGEKIFDKTRSRKDETNKDIINLLGFDINLFEYLVANTSETIPYFKLKEEDKRNIIEKLFGFEVLTDRANVLKEQRKDKKKTLIENEASFEATIQANNRVQSQILELKNKSNEWITDHENLINNLREAISEIENTDSESEIELIHLIDDLQNNLSSLKNNLREKESNLHSFKTEEKQMHTQCKDFYTKSLKIDEQISEINNNKCPTCKQHWVPDKSIIDSMIEERKISIEKSNDLEIEIEKFNSKIQKCSTEIDNITNDINDVVNNLEEAQSITLTYNSIEEAAQDGALLQNFKKELKEKEKSKNPYTDTIYKLQCETIKKVDDSDIKDLRNIITHYNFLIDMLTQKDSFIRKLIIERWLPRLNRLISIYLEKLELPHKIRFNSDLTVSINLFNEEYDYGNLSKGERQRLTMALNFAFQDVFEHMNYYINTLMVDELIDNGICNNGAEKAVSILEDINHRKGKHIYLITHRNDIADRIPNILKVVKEGHISYVEA